LSREVCFHPPHDVLDPIHLAFCIEEKKTCVPNAMKFREKAASPPRQARASGLASKGFTLALASRGGLAEPHFHLTSSHSDAFLFCSPHTYNDSTLLADLTSSNMLQARSSAAMARING